MITSFSLNAFCHARTLKNARRSQRESDAVFAASFGEARVEKGYLARYYLRAMEMKVKDDPQPELIPNEEEEDINLEHVLPEKPESNWPHIDPELAQAYYNRIGNLVLLKAKKNSTVGNSSFADKRKVLKESAFLLTSEVGKSANWRTKEIPRSPETACNGCGRNVAPDALISN